MFLRVLVQANGYISGISMFDDVGVRSVHSQDPHTNEKRQERAPIHIHHERLVGTWWTEIIPDGNLGLDVLGLLVESKSNGFDD